MNSKAKGRKEELTWEWLAPLGLIGVVLLLALNFVGARPFGLDHDRTAQIVEFGLACGAMAIIGWGYYLTVRKRPTYLQVLRDRLLVAIGFCSFLAYFNFGHLHFPNFIHVWDSYHYYMGAKFFPEVGYERLYDCTMISEAESGRREEVARRNITDLRTNEVVKTDALLADPEGRCKKHFTAARWSEFKRDVNTWRSWVNEQRWSEIHKDHGFNATPVWTILGRALTLFGPVSWNQITALNLLDPLYLALTLVMVWWAFGPRAFAIAALVMGTNFPNRFYWTGGAYLRHDWVFYLVACICLLKKDRPFLAGAAIAYSTLLRLFPGLLILGPVIGAVEYLRANRKLDPRFLRFASGGIAATVVLLGVSTAFVGGLDTWKQFRANTNKHASTPLTNHMGLRTVLSYRPHTTGANTYRGDLLDPWANWKATRIQKWREASGIALTSRLVGVGIPVFYLLIYAAVMVLVWLALKHSGPEPWLGAAMGVGFIVLGDPWNGAELTNYYYCFLIGFAVLHTVKREVGFLMALMCALTLFIEMGPLIGMSHALDEQYPSMTVATLIALIAAWWSFTKWGAPLCIEPEAPARIFPHLAMAGVAPASGSPSRQERRKKKRRG